MQDSIDVDTAISVTDAIHTLAFIGDLSMGQPTDHSQRTAWLAAQLAAAAASPATGTPAVREVAGRAECDAARQVALLRWSGCTANAPEFADLIGDDVVGRAIMLEQRPDDPAYTFVETRVHSAVQSLTQIHCEVSGDIARMLGVGEQVEMALRGIFEAHDGGGVSHRRSRAASPTPAPVFVVALASDLEIISRVQGIERALAVIERKGGSAYPAELARLAMDHAGTWLAAVDGHEVEPPRPLPSGKSSVALEMIADVIDLKLPWMVGYSRRIARAAHDCALQLGLGRSAAQRCYRAALLHGVGRASVANPVWNTPGRLPASAWEKVRLAPYWTARAASHAGALAEDAEIASYVGERLDGSGYFRGCRADAIPVEGRIVAAASAWIALQSPRPWRQAMDPAAAAAVLQQEAQAGRFDAAAVQALCRAGMPREAAGNAGEAGPQLTAREIEIFRAISQGLTNKEIARNLKISPSTVRTHVEKVFAKLECNTRAAATLKALTLRLI